jgi:hypothetical protein
MSELGENGASDFAFEAYGLRMAVSAPRPELMERIRSLLPPGSQPCPPEGIAARFALTANERGTFIVTRDGDEISGGQSLDLDLALEILETNLRLFLGSRAPEAIFIHAGAVAHRGKAILIPGTSFAGKTNLVAALVRAGALYYSDEFAVISRDGRVQPYAKDLSIRPDGGWRQTEHEIASLGGVAGEDPVPVGMIVVTKYERGAKWAPQQLSAGAGAMALLEHAMPAQERPDEVMPAIRQAAQDALILQSDRGEADELAPVLLEELERQRP